MSLLTRSSLLPTASSFFEDLFDDNRVWRSDLTKGWSDGVPSANIAEDDKAFNIELAVPGMDKEDFQVDIDSGELRISSEKKDEQLREEKSYTRREFSYSSFMRSFILPESVNTDKINAKYENGILKIILPKKSEVKKLTKKEISIA